MSSIPITKHAVLHHVRKENDTLLAEEGKVPYLSFPVLDQFDFLSCGFSTRLGGVSEGIYTSMNLGFGRGDANENVIENFTRFSNTLGTKAESLVFTDQTHDDIVRVAGKEDCGKGIFFSKDYKGVDGHITDEPDVSLLVFAADCVPVFFADPYKKVVGAVHSGWKGTVAKIGAVTVKKMQETYQSRPSDLVAVIGPCICKDCYEVSADVADKFCEAFDQSLWDKILTQTKTAPEKKYQLDLWEANRLILKEAGLKEENIIVSGVCTMCHPELFFSHRASRGQRGSNAGIITIV